MNDKLQDALIVLANKLGTTAEHLWSVLVKQAPITGVVDLVVLITLITVALCWTYFVRRKSGKGWCRADSEFAWACVAGAWFVVFICFLSFITDIISAFANPEYWALKQIMQLMK